MRRTNLMREKRTLNIIDEFEERLKMQKAFEEAEAKRDMTYDEFLGRYLDHIEGKITTDDRVGNRPQTADGDENNPKSNQPGTPGGGEEMKIEEGV